MSDKPRVVLATDSRDPSGVGEHMLALGEGLSTEFDVTVAIVGEDRTGLLPRAARVGLRIRLAADDDEFRRWLSKSYVALLHVHAGIGWEGHDVVRAGSASGVPVIRTEHLPYLLTDAEQKRQYLEDCSLVAQHIVVSTSSKKSYVAAGIASAQITVVKNGVKPCVASVSRTVKSEELGLSGKTVILTVARFTAQKDHTTLLKAFQQVLETIPSTVLVLVGTGEEQAAAEALAKELGIEQAVRFLGNRRDVFELMHLADLFVLPSRFEGLPLAVLEAMSANLAVVATRIDGSVEALGHDHPFLVEPGNAPALARMCLAALNDREATVIAQKERYEAHFTSSRMTHETAEVYRKHLVDTSSLETETMARTRIGFIGVGGIANRHLDILANFEDVEIVGFADPDLSRADRAASRFGARSYDNHVAMLDNERLDAVYICIPPFAHGNAEFDLIERAIPFFVEKPVTKDLALAEQIATKVKACGLITAVGYHWRYLDTVEEARELLRENPAQLLSGYWLDSTPPPRWWWKEDQSGGQMIEQATHLLDLARFLVGEVTDVYGRAGHKDRSDYPGLDVPTVTTASLTFETGVLANVSSTCLLGWSHRIGLHIFAENLAIELTDRDIMVDVGRGRPVRGADGDPVWREDRDFVDAVKGLQNNIRCPYDDAIVTHRLATAVMSSVSSGQPIKLETKQFQRELLSPLRSPPHNGDEPEGLPPGHRIIRSLGVSGPGEAYFTEYQEGPPAPGHVRLETLYTGLSAGTELTFLKNTNPYFHSRFDGHRGVFISNEPDLRYPVPFLGYMEVARVSESDARGFSPGQIVSGTFGHKTGHTANPDHEVLVAHPADLDPVLGIFVAQMGPIAANGILHADADYFGASVPYLGASLSGRPVVVNGAGSVGMLTALFALNAGASDVVICDPSPFRRERAQALGLTAMTEEEVWQHAKARWHDGAMGRGADFVFQTRATSESLNNALKTLRPQGTVIDLAFYQGGASALKLGEEFHHNGLNIKCAQINRVPRPVAGSWNRTRLAQETIRLLQSHGDAIREHLITHLVSLSEGPRFLHTLINERPDFIQVVFKADQ
ncbi:glycosyltransferase [Rhizobium sp. 2MFCol3.1]|uniref:glycosyltransferase n=1 Tax=Rhizobium sp. 2MFCol3.1 TaxID=1246459 RepID=UPI000378AB6B|nr:glycosyltransferase [Rhizobium sp. 2MFCol3.1]